MAATFGDVIREIQLTAAAVPALLVRQWTFDVYAKLLSGSRWGWQRAVLTHTAAASRTLAAVTLTPGNVAVTSAALFLPGDVGKQLQVEREPLLHIASVADASTATLRAPYPGALTVTPAAVLDAFFVPPAGFQQFLYVADRVRHTAVPHWLALEQVRLWDPGGTQTGSPRGLIAHSLQSVTGAGSASLWYEWWPRNTQGGTYELGILLGPQTASLTDATELPMPLDDRAYILKDGVLARCAMFPGTPHLKNPYFNLALAAQHEHDFQRGRADLAIVNDDQSLDPIVDTVDWRYVTGGYGGDLAYQYSDRSAIGTGQASQWY